MHNYVKVICRGWRVADCLYRIEAKEHENDDFRTVAFVHKLTGVVTYVDPKDDGNPTLQETIQSLIKDIDPKIVIADEQHTATMYCKTAMGDLVLQFEQDKHTGTGYDGAFIGFLPNCCSGDDYFDLVSARVMMTDLPTNIWREPCIMVNAWSDPSTEDSTFKDYIFEEHFRVAMDELDH